MVHYLEAERPIKIAEEYGEDRNIVTLVVTDYYGRPVQGAHIIEMHTMVTGVTDQNGKVVLAKPEYEKKFPYDFPVWNVYFGGELITWYTYK